MAVQWLLVLRIRDVWVSILSPQLAVFAHHTLMILKLDVSFRVQEYTVSQLISPQSRCPSFDSFAVLL